MLLGYLFLGLVPVLVRSGRQRSRRRAEEGFRRLKD